MKSEKGITLVSLTVYVIVMTMVIAITTRISTFWFKNTTNNEDGVDAITQYNSFNSYFAEEVNNPNIKILECQNDFIAFDNGVQYTFNAENKGIYRDRVKICSKVESCTFEQGMNENGKTTVKVTMKILNDVTENRQPIVYTLG